MRFFPEKVKYVRVYVKYVQVLELLLRVLLWCAHSGDLCYVFADLKNFVIQHPEQPDKNIWPYPGD